MEPRSIFFLASDLSPRGSVRQLALIAAGLPRDRFRISIGVLGPIDTSISAALTDAGIPVHAVPIRHAIDIRGIRSLRQVVAAANPTIIHAWGNEAVRAMRLVSAPRYIASAASSPPGGVSGWLTTRRLKQCDRVVPATWAEGERYRRLGVPGDRLTRISPGVAPPTAPSDREAFLQQIGLPAGSRFIAAAGRLEAASGLKSAVWGFDMVRYDFPDLHLVIFGEGPDRESLEDLGRAMMFDDYRIHFAGCRSDLPTLLAHAEIVWVTHERGGVSLALEAMAAGKPVLAAKSAELTEIIEDGQTGYLVNLAERPQLTAKTYPLLGYAALCAKLGEAGRIRAAEHFRADRAIEQFARLYDEVMQPA